MSGKYSVSALVVIPVTIVLFVCLAVAPVYAYRICTFKGIVLDNGWRTMTVRSGGQCAVVNVGWRTKYIPNRRPCIGQRVAVDFILEDGYMKATKVVSLSPLPPSVRCYPPPPPRTSVCRTVTEEGRVVRVPCRSHGGVCSRRPPAYVSNPNWSPAKSYREKHRPVKIKPHARRPVEHRKVRPLASKPAAPPAPAVEKPKETAPTAEETKAITGEVVASTPKRLSIRVTQDGAPAELMDIRVGLKTKFSPFRRPAVGEKVKIQYKIENNEKFGYSVQVVP
jgi:hypothetical protein